jgi:hypothetical protein
MAQSAISFFVDDAALSAQNTRVPDAIGNSGMLGGASNAPGIGISTENPGLEEVLDSSGNGSWSLLDQHENARDSQIGQLLGGNGITPRDGDQPFTWDKSQPLYTDNGAASSGGAEGTAPDATIRIMELAALPTAADKLADPNLDGNLTFPAEGADLLVLADGWIANVP